MLRRDVDETGVSGTGEVADGVEFDWPSTFVFPDGFLLELPAGWVRMTWRGERSSTGLWRDVETMLAVHGHNGATRVVWTDPPVADFVDVALPGETLADRAVRGGS